MSRTATALTLVEPRTANCSCSARRAAPDHHDRLLSLLEEPDEMLALFELAVTWGELDYSGECVVPPACWGSFAEAHEWSDADRASRAFALAADIALASGRR
jgi:hypothetical protein